METGGEAHFVAVEGAGVGIRPVQPVGDAESTEIVTPGLPRKEEKDEQSSRDHFSPLPSWLGCLGVSGS